jgi:hypothetical protein
MRLLLAEVKSVTNGEAYAQLFVQCKLQSEHRALLVADGYV